MDLGDLFILPGLVDTHVHVNEPGRTEWEGFASATRAAAAGGVTTLVEMPLNSIPAATTAAALDVKLSAAERAGPRVDVGFWGGVVPGNAAELSALAAAGAMGFKCFLAPSGVAEFEHVEERDLREAMPVIAGLGLPLLVHAELPGPLVAAAALVAGAEVRRHATHLASRPAAAEDEAIELLIRLCREFGTRVHVVHLASASALPMLRTARAEGLPITVETCPHYLHFDADMVPDGATELKCAPPLRDAANRERLWEALGYGTIDMVVSDHSPCPPALKLRESGDFMAAWGGIASLQLGLSVIWRGARERGYTPADIVRWMCRAPAALAGLEGRKGSIEVGRDADLVVWDPEAEWTVEPARLHHRHPITPYAGLTLPGVVRSTWLRGERIYHDGAFPPSPSGRLLSRRSQ